MNNFSSNADLLLLNAKILTGTSEKREPDAVAVKNGRILAVGASDELSRAEWIKGWGFADYKAKQRRYAVAHVHPRSRLLYF